MEFDAQRCPHCLIDLRGAEIPNSEPPEYYMHTIGVEVRGIYDGVLFWECPTCMGRWHRFPPKHYLWYKAELYVRSLT